jgi:membrane associated rhomboid family serine protease
LPCARPLPEPVAALSRRGGLALLAVGVTLAFWPGASTSSRSLWSTARRCATGSGGRLLTTVLPHGSPMHLVFNVYWLWVFGTLVEEEFGHARTLGIVLLFAAGSSAAEYAFSYGGIGLSAWATDCSGCSGSCRVTTPRFRGAVDQARS